MSTSPISIQGLPRSCNEALILACLAGGPRHGYQLALDLETRSGGAFRLKHGTLYPILHRLEQEALIEGAWDDEGPRGKRKAYRLTPAGQARAAELAEGLAAAAAMDAVAHYGLHRAQALWGLARRPEALEQLESCMEQLRQSADPRYHAFALAIRAEWRDQPADLRRAEALLDGLGTQRFVREQLARARSTLKQ